MTLYISNPSAIAACNAVVDKVDQGSGPGKLKLFGGAVPADADAADTGDERVEFTLPDPAFGDAVLDGNVATATLNPLAAVNASTSGDITHFRIYDSDDNCILQGLVGTSGAEINLTSTTATAGSPIQIDAFTYSHPE